MDHEMRKSNSVMQTLRTSVNLRPRMSVTSVTRREKGTGQEDAKAICEVVLQQALENTRDTKSEKLTLTKSIHRQTAQRSSPHRGQEASCFSELWRQLTRCGKANRKNPDEKIGAKVEHKSLRQRALEEWSRVDVNNDGALVLEEVKLMFRNLNAQVPDDEIAKWMERYDEDKNGRLDFEEFVKMYESIQSLPDLRREFLLAKALGSGQASVEKLRNGEASLEDILLRPVDLQQFVVWSTGGKERPELFECAYRLHCLMNGSVVSDALENWRVPASEMFAHLDETQVDTELTELEEPGSNECDVQGQEGIQEEREDDVGGQVQDSLTGSARVECRDEVGLSDTVDEEHVQMEMKSARKNSSGPLGRLSKLRLKTSSTEGRSRVGSAESAPADGQNTVDDSMAHAAAIAVSKTKTTSPRRLSKLVTNVNMEVEGQQTKRVSRFKRFLGARTRSRTHSQDSSVSGFFRTSLPHRRSKSSETTKLLPKWHPESARYEEPQIGYDLFVQMMTDRSINSCGESSKLDRVYQDMTRPLSHYYISSSHNSYLSGNQLSSQSTAYAIIRALKLGVRVIELDAWNGPNDEPIVTHGNTLCKPMLFVDCLHALKRHGFETSCYPVIITIENHCSMEQQLKQVDYMEVILGENLHTFPSPDPTNLKVGVSEWLSPEDLKYKFVIRDRPDKRMSKQDKTLLKQQQQQLQQQRIDSRSLRSSSTTADQQPRQSLGSSSDVELESTPKTRLGVALSVETIHSLGQKIGSGLSNGLIKSSSTTDKLRPESLSSSQESQTVLQSTPEEISQELERQHKAVSKKYSSGPPKSLNSVEEKFQEADGQRDEELLELQAEDEDDEVEEFATETYDPNKDGVTPALLKLMYVKNVPIPVKKVGQEMVQYRAPGFCTSSSLSEQKMRRLAMPGPRAAALSTYAKNHLIRVFPAGARITSSNYDPVPAWNAGCQIVALNYQSFGVEVWLNQGKFSDNGGCGYVLKPESMVNATSMGVLQNTPLDSNQNSAIDENGGEQSASRLGNRSKAVRLFGHQSIRFGDTGKIALPWALQPGDASFLSEPLELKVELISGHYIPHLSNSSGIHPYVEITLRGLEQDDKTVRSQWVENNGFDPTWRESFSFQVNNVDLALLSFIVRSVDDGRGRSKGKFLAQNVLPLSCLRMGYRCVPLRYANWAPTEEAFLFCRFSLEPANK